MRRGRVHRRVPFLPEGPLALVGLVVILSGVAYIARRRDVPKAYALGLLIFAVLLLDAIGAILEGRQLVGSGTGGFRRQLADGGRFAGPHPLGFRASDFLAGEQWWSPLTSIFVHANFGHALGNVVLLVSAGPALEERVGARKFLTIFFTAALGALAAQTILAYATDITAPDATAVGASGGIFGILTAFAVRYPRERLPLFLFFVFWLPAFAVLLIYLALQFAFAADPNTNVAWWGHFAGFLVGLAFTRGLPAPPRATRAEPGRPDPRGLPDPSKLEPLATTHELKRTLDRVKQFTPEARTTDDTTYVQAWLDKFFARATCPQCGSALERRGLAAYCTKNDYAVDFARK